MLHTVNCEIRQEVNKQMKEAMRKMIAISEMIEEDTLLEEDLIYFFNEINHIKKVLENTKNTITEIITGE